MAKKRRELLPQAETSGKGSSMQCILTEMMGWKMAPGAEMELWSGRHMKSLRGEGEHLPGSGQSGSCSVNPRSPSQLEEKI